MENPVHADRVPGYAAEEIITDAPTRSARLKWVVVVNDALTPGLTANAVACVAASTGALVEGLIAHGGPDAAGDWHPGLPWAGCTILSADSTALADTYARARAAEGVLVVDMPAAAQSHRVYDDYLSELADTPAEKLDSGAISIVGPRNRVDKIVKKASLL